MSTTTTATMALRLSVVAVLLFVSAHEAAAQRVAGKKGTGFEFVPAPLVSYNRSVGFIIGAAPMAMYSLDKKDTISPRSISAVVGFYSTSGTWMGATFHKLYYDEDQWRFLAGAGLASVEFQTFIGGPISDMVDYHAGAYFIVGELQRQIVSHWYAGARFMLSQAETVFDSVATDTLFETYRTLGLVATFDTRDEQYYPRSGTNGELRTDFAPSWMGNQTEVTKLTSAVNYYVPYREQDVLALRAMVGTGVGADLPFNYQFIVGKGKDLRGYTQGEYRGNAMMAAQGEYRMNISGPFGATAFAGVATVYGSSTPEQDGVLLPSIGLGIRYLVFESNKMNIGLDGAIGRNDWGVYFRIGEAF